MESSMFDVRFIQEGGITVGICLGHSPTYSHEWGIDFIARHFSFNACARTAKNPVKDATVEHFPDHGIGFYRFGNISYLIYGSVVTKARMKDRDLTQKELDKNFPEETRIFDQESSQNLRTAWSGSEFGIRIENDDGFLEQLFSAFQKLDVVIFQRPSRFRDKGLVGLCIINKTLASEEFLKSLIQGK